MKVTTYVLLGGKSHRCRMDDLRVRGNTENSPGPKDGTSRLSAGAKEEAGGTITVGAVRVASKTGGLNVRNDDDPENFPPLGICLAGYFTVSRPTWTVVGKADVPKEEASKSTLGAVGIRIQASRERLAVPNVGKGHLPAGTGNNLQRPADIRREPKSAGGIWSGA